MITTDKYDLLVTIARALAQTRTNITESYKEWLICAYACASFGERGREPFHLLSSQSTKYTRQDTDNQFNVCLGKSAQSDNLAPLLSLAKDYGFILRDFLSAQAHTSSRGVARITPTQADSESVWERPKAFPTLFRESLNLASSEPLAWAVIESVLVAVGSVLDECGFLYAGKRSHLNLYSCCVAPPASGKSALSVIREFLSDTHEHKRRASNALLLQYKDTYRNTPPAERELMSKPPILTHYLPADTSVSALIKTISDNEGGGIIWESELDTLTRNFKSDYGNFSDGLRNNWGGESISYNRKTDRELVEIKDPHFSVCVSCTPAQVPKFFGSAENGLFSRFLFCRLPQSLEWVSQWEAPPTSPIISSASHQLAEMRERSRQAPITIVFPKARQDEHTRFFEDLLKSYYGLLGDEMLAVVKRLGLAWARIVSILTICQAFEDGAWMGGNMPPHPEAIASAYSIIERVASDTAEVLLTLAPADVKGNTRREQERSSLLSSLPSPFTLAQLPPTMSKSAKYRLVRLWLDTAVITKDGNQYRKI